MYKNLGVSVRKASLIRLTVLIKQHLFCSSLDCIDSPRRPPHPPNFNVDGQSVLSWLVLRSTPEKNKSNMSTLKFLGGGVGGSTIRSRPLQNKCCLINTVNRIRMAFRTLTTGFLYKFGFPGDRCCLINTVNSKCKHRVPCAQDCLSTSAFRNYTNYHMTVGRHMRYPRVSLFATRPFFL